MPSGRSFTTKWRQYTKLEQRLYSANCPSAIWLRSTLPTATYSVLVVSLLTIWSAWFKQLAQVSSQLAQISNLNISVLANDSKSDKLVARDSISSKDALQQRHAHSSFVVVPNSSSQR